ncbi:LysM peptidoglycan-binding domain-containing protein [Brevibacterium sp. UMB1308A]|uniref:LysM peptidoglycan-binding domain-containing protein n=1 Tax=Brevibacterium sp. UMB1308A TaxID=3050608 RepID=UPI00254DC66C|nr:LysM peptidoglycan-binding domain-containing protein [Brevibacterium sp. UMB1308A]MDK8345792.1 LysM peptidoglycan-binding domain-containing protein [Brevibacterium sp. UMB1308B]MDK8712788.1 LysM peptidoglycan-binding domain-containing protein [Brevibacterium sp. UMB1308A]
MLRRIIGVSVAHVALCCMAALWHQPALQAIRSGDLSMALIAVCVGLAIVAGIRLQLAVMAVLTAWCVRHFAPQRGHALSQLALWLAPTHFKKGIAVAVGLVIASASQATASPMWPTSSPPSHAIEAPELTTPSPIWPTSTLASPHVETPGPPLPSPTWPTTNSERPRESAPPAHSPARTSEPALKKKPAPKEQRTYTVRTGDSLWKIAQKMHVDPDALFNANRTTIGKNPNLIFPGQELIVP